MRTIHRSLRASLVWVTAAATLFAHTPRLQCRCPDGHVKPFCLSLFLPSSGCCCSGQCCGFEDHNRSGECPASTTTPATDECPCCCQSSSTAAKHCQDPETASSSKGCSK